MLLFICNKRVKATMLPILIYIFYFSFPFYNLHIVKSQIICYYLFKEACAYLGVLKLLVNN